jgi:hypothetical protein
MAASSFKMSGRVTRVFWLFTALVVCTIQGKNNSKTISVTRLGNVLSCLQAKISPLGYPPPRFGAHSFRVRYLYGIQSPGDSGNNLHVFVYGPKEDSATLYEVYIHGANGREEIYFGSYATFKKEGGKLVLDEIPGGLGTAHRIEQLFASISRQRATMISEEDVKPGAT